MGRDICFRVRCIRVQDVKDDGYLEVVFSRGRSLIDGDREVLVLVRDGEFPGTFFPGNVGLHCNHKGIVARTGIPHDGTPCVPVCHVPLGITLYTDTQDMLVCVQVKHRVCG